ncbi:LamG-like jellyroll fold domain-containing protein [Kaistia sp. MMO-174]|uniref:LamG-like jellyroll fold domain-containing protein n=1 Tax=Kaistia sp. MMO-174 TaxID=3081256 RepID=UPI003018E366
MGVSDNDPFFSKVAYLAHMEGANNSTSIVDSSKTGLSVPVSGVAKITTAKAKFGAASLDVTGAANCYAQSAANAALALPADFTMECFVNIRGTVGTGDWCIFDLRSASATTGPCILHTGGYAICGQVNGSIRWTDSANSQNAWKHVAIARAGSTCRMFVDGVQIGANYSFATAIGNGQVTLGKFYNANNGDAKLKLNGNIDEVRVTVGRARYTSNFAPPALPFPNR